MNENQISLEYIDLWDYACESEGIERMFKNVLSNYEGITPLQTCIEEVLKDIYNDMETMLYRYSCDRNNDDIAKRECKNKYIEEMMSFYLQKRIDFINECYREQHNKE